MHKAKHSEAIDWYILCTYSVLGPRSILLNIYDITTFHKPLHKHQLRRCALTVLSASKFLSNVLRAKNEAIIALVKSVESTFCQLNGDFST